jgi:hypothetical protein
MNTNHKHAYSRFMKNFHGCKNFRYDEGEKSDVMSKKYIHFIINGILSCVIINFDLLADFISKRMFYNLLVRTFSNF